MVEEEMSFVVTERTTGDFAIEIERMINARFAEAGFTSHGIAVERTNDKSVTLVRSAPSNECRKNVTLVIATHGNFPPPTTLNVRRLIKEREERRSETTESRNEEEWRSDLDAYVARAIRAERRNRAILKTPGACERFPWTNTVHVLVKQWLEDEGCDLSEQGEEAYTNSMHPPGTIDVGGWYFIDGYATCEGIQNARKDVKLFSNQTDRTVRLEIAKRIPESAALGLVGKPLKALSTDGFLGPHGDLKIEALRPITNMDGEMVLSVTVEPRETPMAHPPQDFDATWMES